MASLQQQLMRRIGVARVVVNATVGEPNYETVSEIQKDAVLELLQDAMAAWRGRPTGQDVATIAEQAMRVQWFPDHLDEVLGVLRGRSQTKRRKQQQYSSLSNYLSDQGWTQFLATNLSLNARADYFIDFAISLDCINPTEPTYKKWASDTLVAHFDKDTCRSLTRESLSLIHI